MILREIANEAVAGGAGAPKVLVVDDDATSRLLAGAALKDQMQITEAENGEVALQILGRESFDLTILDLDMPVLDGFAVIEQARARPETRHLPIIVVTGREDVVSIERAFALGATSFLCKPINWNVFRHQVAYVFHKAQVERRLRAKNEQLEQVAALRARSIAALSRSIESAATRLDCPPEGQPASTELHKYCEKMRKLVRRVGHVSDVLTGSTEFFPQAAEAHDVAAAAVAMLESEDGSVPAERIDIQESEPLKLHGDADLVKGALVEILANALEASPSEERVQLRVVGASPNRVRFEIEDHGAGIPEHLLEAGIADLAADVAAGSNAKPGLGLALAKAVVDRHHGHFGIVSEPGRGTEVFLSFPAAAEADGEATLNQAVRIAS